MVSNLVHAREILLYLRARVMPDMKGEHYWQQVPSSEGAYGRHPEDFLILIKGVPFADHHRVEAHRRHPAHGSECLKGRSGPMRVLILEAGATGGLWARLLRRQGCQVWCGDREPERARAFVGRQIKCRSADARGFCSVVRAACGCQLLVNPASSVYNHAVTPGNRLPSPPLKGLRYSLRTFLDTCPACIHRRPFHRAFAAHCSATWPGEDFDSGKEQERLRRSVTR